MAQYNRIAVIADSALASGGLSDLVIARLSEEPDLQLVERERITAAFAELELATALAPDGAGSRLKLGRLVQAQFLVLSGLQREAQRQYVQVVICDASLGARLNEARAAALAWVAAEPRASAPRYALADIEGYQRSGLDSRYAKTRVLQELRESWAARDLGSYALWRVFAEPSASSLAQGALPKMIQGLLFRDRTERLHAEVFLFEDTSLVSSWLEPRGLAELCNRWEEAAATIDDPPRDRSYLTFRTIDLLRKRDFVAARAQYEKAVSAFESGQVWADPRPLLPWIEQRVEQSRYEPPYAPGGGAEWPIPINCLASGQ